MTTTEPSPLSRKAQRTSRRAGIARKAWAIGAGAVLLAAVVVVAQLWPRSPDVHVVEVAGVEYTTNVAVREEAGAVYAYLPVNAAIDEVVLTVADHADSATIRAFLDGLDTFVPGEYVIELTDAPLHLIVDGIPEQE
ncbi:hypothetical protein F6J84_13570 [Microbacterium caowuchunii]|uniref:hypothetical protein n=1 Tax=Microbacterium caowuchunii TaxID=2614638 RepID=UPI001248F6E2|nr:hypothetical protein [Microbacterium caowuchunii]QEW01025.1 hypothetical protein F6J84_13570 [Microbacterium caowuchunii]